MAEPILMPKKHFIELVLISGVIKILPLLFDINAE